MGCTELRSVAKLVSYYNSYTNTIGTGIINIKVLNIIV